MFAPFLFFFFFLFFFESSTFTRNGAPSCFVAAAGGCGSSSLCDCFPPIVSIVLSDSPSFFPLSPPVSHTILSPHSLLFPLHHHLWYLPFSSLFLSLSLSSSPCLFSHCRFDARPPLVQPPYSSSVISLRSSYYSQLSCWILSNSLSLSCWILNNSLWEIR